MPEEIKVIGSYFPNNRKMYAASGEPSMVFFTEKTNNYIPILNLFEFNVRDEVVFTDGKSVSNEIVSYNKNNTTQSLTESIIAEKRIDITQNDLTFGPVRIVLNFTNKDVLVRDLTGFRKNYAPVKSTKLIQYDGKLIIFSLYSFNNPTLLGINHHGYQTYINDLVAQYHSKTDYNYLETKLVLKYLQGMYENNTDFIKASVSSNTVKVVTTEIITEEELTVNRALYLKTKRVIVGFEPINKIIQDTAEELELDKKELLEYIKDNSYVCYIVDKDNQKGDRYLNVAGHVTKIHKSKNPLTPDGLYILTADQATSVKKEHMFTLDEMDKNKYVYKSIEEANDGADLSAKYQELIEKSRAENQRLLLEKENENIRLRADHDKLKSDHERKMKELAYEYERISLGNKSRHEEYKYNVDRSSMYNKYQYEEKKYERDTTVETIKTVGLLSSLALTGYLLLNKSSK